MASAPGDDDELEAGDILWVGAEDLYDQPALDPGEEIRIIESAD